MNAGLAFLAPLGLVALAGVLVILVLHMRRRTPPAIMLPSLRFWLPAQEDHADRNRLRRPPLSLPLILQLLAALLIGLGLARPAVDGVLGGVAQRTEPEHLIMLLDGSTSMNAMPYENDSRSRWDLARLDAADLLGDWQEGDVVTVVIAAGRLDTFSASTRLQVDAALERLESAPVPGGQMDLNAALELTRSLLLPDRSNRVVVLTDGAVRADPAIAASIAAPIDLRVIGESDRASPNYAITQVGARPVSARSDQFRLSMTVTSFDANAARIPYLVAVDGTEIVSNELDLGSGQSRTVQVNLPPEATEAQVSIQVRDGLEVDNRATVLLDEAGLSALNILLLSDAPGPLERALSVIPGARVEVWETTTPGIKALAAPYDLVVFEGTTPSPADIPDAPMIFVHPQAMEGAFVLDGVMSGPQIQKVEIGDPMLEGVDLAGVTVAEAPVYNLAETSQALIQGGSGGVTGPLMWRGTLADQPYVGLAFDIASSNISQRVAFPVLVAQIVGGLTEDPLPDTVAIGEPLVYRPSTAADVVEFISPAGATERLSHVSSPTGSSTEITFEETGQPGIYDVREIRADGAVAVEGRFVVNGGHLVESDLRQRPELERALVGGDARESSQSASTSVADLWPFLAAAGTLLILAEWLVWVRSIPRGRFSVPRSPALPR
jgi:hypothetical protein